jgi:hypothetical protein
MSQGPLSADLRKLLEKAVVAARDAAEDGARKALHALAVEAAEPFSGMAPEQRLLRNRLRAHARQLGDPRDPQKGTQGIARLTHECAYEHWHRMLFARFLAENDLLIEPETKVPVSLEDCRELARERKADPWDLASRFAQRMLPQIFRPDDPSLQVALPPEHQGRLENLLEDLPPDVFRSTDGLGWVYQFWQSKKKDEVNRSEVKIGADELPAVTQLFTEHYMVLFLLHNTIGAWYAGKVLRDNPEVAESAENEAELRRACCLPGYEWEYLRFVRENEGKGLWRPAAGTFDGWPKAAKEITVLDPCCGSGHFLVAAFDCLTALRMREEKLPKEDAAEAVIADNLHGLEIDPRCTQLAAFAVALAAWKFIGKVTPLPPMKIACSGLSVGADKKEWAKMGGKDERLRAGMEQLHDLFEQGPTLGSLIGPRAVSGDLYVAGFRDLQPLLERALTRETSDEDEHELAVTAQGLALAWEILSSEYTLVVTNVPYLTRNKQGEQLRHHCDSQFTYSKHDLATTFLERCVQLDARYGATAVVMPQNWLFLASYSKFRRGLLESTSWNLLARLGPAAFQDMNWWAANTQLLVLQRSAPAHDWHVQQMDVSNTRDPLSKGPLLVEGPIRVGSQSDQLANPEARVTLEPIGFLRLLEDCAIGLQGVSTADNPRFQAFFWEMRYPPNGWVFHQGSVNVTMPFGGRESILNLNGVISEGQPLGAAIRGQQAWGRMGVVVRQMRHLPATLGTGESFDTNVALILPLDTASLPAIWAFCSSEKYQEAVRGVDQKSSVTNSTLVKVPFDLAYWQKVASEKYANGLPEPESDDPTQWLFHGRPEQSAASLQVAVARLLGFRWPAELGDKMRLSKRAKDLVKRCGELVSFADPDGIVCLPPVRGEEPAASRLRALLAAAFGKDWSPAQERESVAATGAKSETLEDWLRDEFFAQHCTLFHHRPFVWHVWDGRRDGFHALVNYHRLAEGDSKGRKTLETLTYACLGDWIARQKAGVKAGEAGAEARLAAAAALQGELEKILAGEPPYDIFVRWKPLHQQAIGWDPDINDGVRLNIRAFMSATLPGGRAGAGILRWKPNIKWDKDRGKEPSRPKEDYPWFWGWDGKSQDWKGGREFKGERFNACHYTNKAKQEARERKSKSPAK